MLTGHSLSDRERIKDILNKKNVKIHFIGIGGISMSALALMAQSRGCAVSGSDIRETDITKALVKRGIRLKYSHSRSYFMSIFPDIAVYSLAIDSENPEYRAALTLGIPIVSRAELLGVFMQDYKIRIGVSGAHGKSTVSAMLASILGSAGFNPTVLVGASINADNPFGFRSGGKDYLVYEACEYRDSFLRFLPSVSVFLNFELDHTDYFKDEASLSESFVKAANLSEMFAVVNYDCDVLRELLPQITVPVYTFSQRTGADYRYEICSSGCGEYSVMLWKGNIFVGSFKSSSKGGFNALNAAASAVVSDLLGINGESIDSGLLNFVGLKRRLELFKKTESTSFYYDYAHHPSEISALYSALSDMGYKRISAVFCPHTYSRTAYFMDEFAKELSKFEKVYITDIYGARELAVVGVTASALAEKTASCGGRAFAVGVCEVDRVIAQLNSKDNDAVVLMGAGNLDIYKKKIEKLF